MRKMGVVERGWGVLQYKAHNDIQIDKNYIGQLFIDTACPRGRRACRVSAKDRPLKTLWRETLCVVKGVEAMTPLEEEQEEAVAVEEMGERNRQVSKHRHC